MLKSQQSKKICTISYAHFPLKKSKNQIKIPKFLTKYFCAQASGVGPEPPPFGRGGQRGRELLDADRGRRRVRHTKLPGGAVHREDAQAAKLLREARLRLGPVQLISKDKVCGLFEQIGM